MKVSSNIIGIIKNFEGYTPVAAQLKGDRKGVITGGYGTINHPNGTPVKIGDLFSRDYALECLMHEIDEKCVYLNKILNIWSVLLNQNQFDALACFVYNVGTGAVGPESSVGKALRDDNMKKVADTMLLWNKGTVYVFGIPVKKKLQGLVNRRKTERELFLS